MTIKELCDKQEICDHNCPFNAICCLHDDIWHLFSKNDEANKDFTKSIIETAKMLVCEGETNYNG